MTYFAIWWMLGTATMVYGRWEGWRAFTYGDLTLSLLVGCAGPLLWVAMFVVTIWRIDLWDKPLFSRAERPYPPPRWRRANRRRQP
jgi:hypothetical protein